MLFKYNEITLLKHTLSFTGETELGVEGKDVPSARKLNGKESSQRRHFIKNTEEVTKGIEEKIREMQTKHNELLEEVKKEHKAEPLDEEGLTPEEVKAQKALLKAQENAAVAGDPKLKESIDGINDEVKVLFEAEHEVEIRPETLEVVKKYFTEWGENIGFNVGDDAAVEALETKLK